MTTKTVKHTPGPWEYAYGAVYDKQGVPIGGVDRDTPLTQPVERNANARLMAAAPELLEALEYTQELIGVARRHFPKSIQNSDTFQLENICATVGKAIHKARGE